MADHLADRALVADAASHKWRRELPAGASAKQVRSGFEKALGRL